MAPFVPPRQSQQRHKHRSPGPLYSSQIPRDDPFPIANPSQHVQESRPQPSSSVLSFSVSDPPNSASTVMTNDGRRPYLKSSDHLTTMLHGEGRGKKHQCPHCGKRFNRPSSMKIHVNTHTGAKRTFISDYLGLVRLQDKSCLPRCITSSQFVCNSPRRH